MGDGASLERRLVLSRNIPPGGHLLDGEGHKTIVLIGGHRNGKTLASGLLQILGVEFGDVIADRAEDLDVTRTLLRLDHGRRFWRLLSVRREFGRIMLRRQERWGTWAFKSPYLAPWLWALGSRIPNPRYVLVVRNPLSSALSLGQARGIGWPRAIITSLVQQLASVAFGLLTRAPILVVAQERVIAEPRAFVDAFVEALGIEATEETRTTAARFIDPALGTKTTRRLLGWVETVEPQRVTGWIADLAHPDHSLQLEVFAGPDRLAAGKADLMRADVRAAGHHATGHCGFALALCRTLTDRDRARLRVHVPALGHDLKFGLDPSGRSTVVTATRVGAAAALT